MKESEIDKLIYDCTRKFSESIPDGNPDKKDLISEFVKYLKDSKEYLLDSPTIRDSKILMAMGIKHRTRYFTKLDLDSKKISLGIDPNLRKLCLLGQNYYELAQETLLEGDRLTDKIDFDDFDVEEKLEEMVYLKGLVRGFGLTISETICTEAKCDLQLIRYLDTDVLSGSIYEFLQEFPPKERKKMIKTCEWNSRKYVYAKKWDAAKRNNIR